MAVVNLLAAGLPDLSAAKPGTTDVRVNHGKLRTSTFEAAINNGDSVASTYEVARIPSHARISKLSKLHSSGIAGLTDVDLGVSDDVNCLSDGVNLTATATSNAADQVSNTKVNQPLWQLAGLTKDPKEEMPVFLTLQAAATAAGTVWADLVYIVD